jgi:hypothetical protein
MSTALLAPINMFWVCSDVNIILVHINNWKEENLVGQTMNK